MGIEDYPQVVIAMGVIVPFVLFMLFSLHGRFESEEERRGFLFAGMVAMIVVSAFMLSSLIR